MTGLCLIAGRGRLPEILAQSCPEARIVAVAGHAPEALEADDTLHLETLGSFLNGLSEAGIGRLCFAGAVSRPEVDPARIDAETMPLVPRLKAALAQGDDGALGVLVALVEERGIQVVGAHELLPDLLPPEGCLGARAPGQGDDADISRAFAVLAATGPADIGQGCVVARGQVLAVEAAPGTDWMLESVAALRGEGPLGRPSPPGGVFGKAPKPGQDRRIDLPAIGPETVRRAAAAGLSGIALEAGGVMILDRAATIDEADRAGLFVQVAR